MITLEKFADTYEELEPLYRRHYEEMRTRLAGNGVTLGDYAPRLDVYRKAGEDGWLLTFVMRQDGKAIGYSNIYVTNDMHNGEKIAQEDTVYILPQYRNGNGARLIKFFHAHLKEIGCKRLNITTSTDLRVAKLLSRMKYAQTAYCMTLVL